MAEKVNARHVAMALAALLALTPGVARAATEVTTCPFFIGEPGTYVLRGAPCLNTWVSNTFVTEDDPGGCIQQPRARRARRPLPTPEAAGRSVERRGGAPAAPTWMTRWG